MATPYHHALSSVRRQGGQISDYIQLHSWFDASKELMPDFRHRALRHHTQGIFEAERVFGVTITNSNGKKVPTRVLGEQHVLEDLGFIPTLQDWLKNLKVQPWMCRNVNKAVARGEAEVDIKKEEPVEVETHPCPILSPATGDSAVAAVLRLR